MRRPPRVLLLLALLGPPLRSLSAQQSAATAQVFRTFANHVVKIQVIETGSSAKSTIGSGFFVTGRGHVVTNYHVISSLINAPERYRAELIDSTGTAKKVKVIAIDVVHDLAILSSGLASPSYFTPAVTPIAQGDRLFALGHPRDLGLSIVEGTNNGLLLHTLYPHIHFTGSLNPGMSGGPTIDESGHVIGVNVSTAGNQLSFLVPADRVVALLAKALATDGKRSPSLAQVGLQLREYQDVYLRNMFDSSTQKIAFGPFHVITQPAPFFRCWGDASPARELAFQSARHSCETDDEIYLSEDQTTGSVSVTHQLLTSQELNAFRFMSLYSERLGRHDFSSGDEEYVTPWKCKARNVANGATKQRAILCVRRYRKLGELYDGVLKVAVLGAGKAGLVSTLTMSGVTFANLDRLSRRYLGMITWH